MALPSQKVPQITLVKRQMQVKAESVKNRTVCKDRILRGTSVAQIRKLKTNEI